jgi:excisionase family DNA binding protein
MDTLTINQKENEAANKITVSPRHFEPQDLMDDGKLLKLLYTIAETAFLLSQSDKTIRRLLERGLLRASKATRHILITRESILAFLKTTV